MRNAFSGYTYQHRITLLLLALMDVERVIKKIEIEAKTGDNFDDLVLTTENEIFQIQIKDFENVSLDKLTVENDKIIINGKAHKLSPYHNIIFFKNIDIINNEKFLEFPCFRVNDNLSIVSLSRVQTDILIDNLYINNVQRNNEIDSFFNTILDKRIWKIPIELLPPIKKFITELQEKSVEVTSELLNFDGLLLIEGKPGIGKSHFVNTLTLKYAKSIIYRFWIGNQDKDYLERLKFSNFIRDLNANLFYDQKHRSQEEILNKLRQNNNTIIIDGLDHIENYNKAELYQFAAFIESAAKCCKTIVLSRPLKIQLSWQKHILHNWSFDQTKKVLKELFHIDEYTVIDNIYNISDGYPIIVKFLAEHYKLHTTLPQINKIDTINSYYENVINNTKIRSCLTLFLCCNSFIMESEIDLFIGDEKVYVEEFIEEYPYLFDIKLNRISLVHDSFNTFLRQQVNHKKKSQNVAAIVYDSIMKLELRFLSRYSYFELSLECKKNIIKKYSSINVYRRIIKNCIDPEALSSFYNQLRDSLKEIEAKDLSINQYYDLSLILSLTIRDHLSTANSFYYTYVKGLLNNGINDEDITSSDFLYGMYYYVKTRNASLLLNRTSIDLYDITNFHRRLEIDIINEDNHILRHNNTITKKTAGKLLKDQLNLRENIVYICENLYINNIKIKGLEILNEVVNDFLAGKTYRAEEKLKIFLKEYRTNDYYPNWIINDIRKNLLSYGYYIDSQNEFLNLSLKKLILKYREVGSFKLFEKIHTYIRLANHENREIDIESISIFWNKYYNRKDYTLLSIPTALNILESKKMLSLYECVELISKIQNISEKGYRGLLSDFIILYSPKKIINFLEQNFDVTELNVEWFDLPKAYINIINENTFYYQLFELIRRHSYNKTISFAEIKNALCSKRLADIESVFERSEILIKYKTTEKKFVSKFNGKRLLFSESVEEKNYHSTENATKNFERGILDPDNKRFIQKNRLKATEIAKYADENYTSLSDVRIFDIYPPKEVSKNLKEILYNSLIRKTNSTKYFHNIYYHPGNVLALINKFSTTMIFYKAVKSFEKFINLSLFDIKITHNKEDSTF